jgi:hypothetical protein
VNPFERNDVVDRLLIFTFGKFDLPDGPQAISENDTRQSVLKYRNELFAEVIVRLQLILKAVEPRREVHYPTSFRMKDFAHFCLAAADAEGWLPRMTRMFANITEEQKQLSLQGNPLYLLLRLAIGEDPESLRERSAAADLGRRLARIASIAQLEFPARGNPRALSNLLTLA